VHLDRAKEFERRPFNRMKLANTHTPARVRYVHVRHLELTSGHFDEANVMARNDFAVGAH